MVSGERLEKKKMGKEKEKMELMNKPQCTEVPVLRYGVHAHPCCCRVGASALQPPLQDGEGEVLFAANLGGTRYFHHRCRASTFSVPCAGVLWTVEDSGEGYNVLWGKLSYPPQGTALTGRSRQTAGVLCQHIGPSSPPNTVPTLFTSSPPHYPPRRATWGRVMWGHGLK